MQVSPQLSGRQLRLFRFIQTYQAREGRPPTYAEMQAELGISSKSLVRYHLDVLVKNGYLERSPAVARGVRPAGRRTRQMELGIAEHDDAPRAAAPDNGRARPRASIRVPLLGTVDGRTSARPAQLDLGLALDDPALDVPEALELTRAMVPDEPGLYALRVSGNALIDALVKDGDIVVLRPQAAARDGELVAVYLRDRDEYAFKRWYREPERVRLEPANPAYPVLYVHPEKVAVQGSVVAVIREC